MFVSRISDDNKYIYVAKIEQKIDTKANSKSKLAAIEKVKDAIKAVQSQAFDTLTMIGSEGEIDFAGFMGSASVAAAVNFGVLFTPIRSIFMTRKAYKYFLAIIKQTIRRNLLIIQLNFDQFENLILQKSFETDNDSEISTMSETLSSIIFTMQRELVGKDSKLKFTGKRGEEMRKYLANFKETQNALIRQHKEDTKNNCQTKVEKITAALEERKVKRAALRKNPYKIRASKNHVVLLLIAVMAVAALTGFLNPAGDGAYTYLVKTLQGNTTDSINEHLPLTLSEAGEFAIALITFLLKFLNKLERGKIFATYSSPVSL